MLCRREGGHILLLVLTVVFLLGLLLQHIAAGLTLEYKRVANNSLEYTTLQRLEAKIQTMLQTVRRSVPVPGTVHGSMHAPGLAPVPDVAIAATKPAFIADTLELTCQTGINVAKLVAIDAACNTQLIVTYSVRK